MGAVVQPDVCREEGAAASLLTAAGAAQALHTVTQGVGGVNGSWLHPSSWPDELTLNKNLRSIFLPERRAEVRFSSLKQEGNDFVKRSQYQEALTKYTECLKIKPEECAIYTNR